jgi:hypothetical protein
VRFEDKVRRPDLVRLLRAKEWLTVGDGDLLPAPALQLEAGLCVEPVDPLVIHAIASLAQLRIDQAGAVPPMPVRQGEDAIPQRRIRVGPHVPQRRGAHTDHRQRALDDAWRKLTRVDAPSLVERNRALHRMLVDGVTVEYLRKDGSIAGAQARVIDSDTPANAVNHFTVSKVSTRGGRT